jgi:raffinose/stachyose/melibiose transport system substrate-binding protein
VKRRLTGLLVIVAVAVVAVGVGVSYGGGKATTTLTMWSYDNQDPGLEPVLKQLSKEFEASHPGVKINLVFKDFNSLVSTVPRALASGQRPRRDRGQPGLPDGCAAREGEAIIPLTKYVNKYGWNKLYAPSTWGCSAGRPDGKSFGKGPVWGLAQTGQNIAVFYNKKKFKQAGVNPNTWPTTYAGFEAMLAQAAGEPPKSDR